MSMLLLPLLETAAESACLCYQEFLGLGDGTCDLALVSKVSRCANLNVMRTVALKGGKGVGLRGVQNENICNCSRVFSAIAGRGSQLSHLSGQ